MKYGHKIFLHGYVLLTRKMILWIKKTKKKKNTMNDYLFIATMFLPTEKKFKYYFIY